MPEHAALIALVFLLAGTIKGTVGIGLPTVSVALLSQFLPPHAAVALIVGPLCVTNLWQVIRSGASRDTLTRYLPLILCLMVSIFVTTLFTLSIPPGALLTVIGLAVVTFALTSLIKPPPPLPDSHDRIAQVATGLSAGVLGGLTTIWAPPVVIYLLAKRLAPDEFVRAIGLFLFLGSLPLAVGFWNTGLLNDGNISLSAAMVLPALLGFSIGEAIRKRIPAARFRTILLWIFLLMGLRLILPF